MALVLTLLTVSFLVAVTVQLATSVNWQMQAAANQRNIVQLDAMLLSGLNLARAALLADQQENDFDSALDSWGTLDADTLSAIFGNGRMGITVTDLSGLLQVNALVLTEDEKKRRAEEEQAAERSRKPKPHRQKKRPKKDPEKIQRDLWKRFLLSENIGLEDEDLAASLVDSLSDWLDKDEDERENGAEQGYYGSLDPPYVPANGPIIFPEELLLVKGWNKKLLYGNKEHSGIIADLTIYGQDGKININTAPPLVLQALSSAMTDEFITDLIEFRNNKDNRDLLAEPGWYRGVSGFPGDITFDKDMLTTRSSYFMVTITAEIDGLVRTGSGVLHRMDNHEQQLLYWKVE
jgi:general secretion pathway protein K